MALSGTITRRDMRTLFSAPALISRRTVNVETPNRFATTGIEDRRLGTSVCSSTLLLVFAIDIPPLVAQNIVQSHKGLVIDLHILPGMGK
jgi:hypothetical protein